MNKGLSNEDLQFWYGQERRLIWKCEPGIKQACAAFAEEYPECVPAPGNRASFYVGIRKLVREFGEIRAIAFIHWARGEINSINREKVRSNSRPLDVVDAHSIGFLIPKFKRQGVDKCPDCSEHFSACVHEWGSQKRNEMFGGEQ